MMFALDVQQLTVRFNDIAILDRFDLAVNQGEIVAVMGPSGSGKSTLLRAIAGLQPIHGGQILIDNVDTTNVAIHRRQLGFVFQDLALFPHLCVGDNIAYGLRRQKVGRADRDRRVDEMLELVGLPEMKRRNVTTLSGGEQQRVALARALSPMPKVLLLDEPLAALDAEHKTSLSEEIRRIIVAANATAAYVTHDQDEARRVADRVVRIAK
jgi:thiamine transport system ATP-binding protein